MNRLLQPKLKRRGSPAVWGRARSPSGKSQLLIINHSTSLLFKRLERRLWLPA